MDLKHKSEVVGDCMNSIDLKNAPSLSPDRNVSKYTNLRRIAWKVFSAQAFVNRRYRLLIELLYPA